MGVATDCLDREALVRALAGFGVATGEVCAQRQVTSTNDRARELAADRCPDWTVVAAEGQTAGRGRRGRSWVSPAGLNLYLSVVTPVVAESQHLPQLPLVAGLAVARAIDGLGVAVALKWPNDVLAPGGDKLAGVLVEGLPRAGGRAVIGIGVNANAGPGDLPDGATSLRVASGTAWDRPALAAALVGELQRAWHQLAVEGFPSLQQAWAGYALWLGEDVTVSGETGRWAGKLVGIDQWGRLRLATGSGEQRFSAGEVSLRRGDGEA